MPKPSPDKSGRGSDFHGAPDDRNPAMQVDGPLSPLRVVDSDDDFKSLEGVKVTFSPVASESKAPQATADVDGGVEPDGPGCEGAVVSEKSAILVEHDSESREDSSHVPPANEHNGDDNGHDDDEEDDKVWVAESKTKSTRKNAPGRAKKQIAKKELVPKRNTSKKLVAQKSVSSKKSTPETAKENGSSSKPSAPAVGKKLSTKASPRSQSSEMQDSGPVTPKKGKTEAAHVLKQGSSEKKPVLKQLSAGKQKDKKTRDNKSSDDKESESNSGRKLDKALFPSVPKYVKASKGIQKPVPKARDTPVSKVSKAQGKNTTKNIVLKGPKAAKMAARNEKGLEDKPSAPKTPKRKRDNHDSLPKSAKRIKKQKTASMDTDDEEEISPTRTTIDAEEDESDDGDESEREELVPSVKRPYLGAIACSSADFTTRDLLDAAVNSLGGYCCAGPEDATLFVMGEVRRGPALLTAISRGIPVLSQAFLTKAITDGKWPTDCLSFEQHAGAKQSRLTKENPKAVGFLKDKRIKLSGPLPIDTAALSLMIRESGGRVVSTREDVVLSETAAKPGVNSVSLKWFADSIEEQRLMPFESYRMAV